MNWLLSLNLLLTLSSMGIGSHAFAKVTPQGKIKFAFGEHKPPYVSDKNEGLEVDLATAIFAAEGYELEKAFSSNTRIVIETSQKRIHGGIGVAAGPTKGVCTSDPYIRYDNVAISLKNDHLSINSIEDLSRYTFTTFKGGPTYLGPVFKKFCEKHVCIEDRNQEMENKKFWSGRAKVIILDRHIFEAYRSILKTEFNTDQEVVYHEIFEPQYSDRYAIFHDPKYCDVFNSGLKKIKKNGTYKKIVERYIPPVRK